MKAAVLLILIGLVLVLFLAPMLVRGVDVFRPVLDDEGRPVYDEEGRPKVEPDLVGEFKVNWDAYSAGLGGGVCVVCGLVLAVRQLVRSRRARLREQQSAHR